jgi:hypothetical protein
LIKTKQINIHLMGVMWIAIHKHRCVFEQHVLQQNSSISIVTLLPFPGVLFQGYERFQGDSHHKQKEDIMYLNVDGFSGHWFVWDMTCFPSLPTSAGSCSIPLVAKSNTSFQSLTFFVRSLS